MKRRELLGNVLGPAMPAEKEDDLKPKKSGPRGIKRGEPEIHQTT